MNETGGTAFSLNVSGTCVQRWHRVAVEHHHPSNSTLGSVTAYDDVSIAQHCLHTYIMYVPLCTQTLYAFGWHWARRSVRPYSTNAQRQLITSNALRKLIASKGNHKLSVCVCDVWCATPSAECAFVCECAPHTTAFDCHAECYEMCRAAKPAHQICAQVIRSDKSFFPRTTSSALHLLSDR